MVGGAFGSACADDSDRRDAGGRPAATDAVTVTAEPVQPTTTQVAVTDELTTNSPASSSSSSASTLADSNDKIIETRNIGRSVENRPIIGERRGSAGGRVVLIVGVIHGSERDAMSIMERLHDLEVPKGVDLWLVDSMNPDGYAADTRQNANKVDLNRNFPHNWEAMGEPGDWQYSGSSAASEPETKAMMKFIVDIDPELTIWYHQNYYRITPGTGRDGRIRQRYAELTGLPLLTITGGKYTGTATTWMRQTLDPGIAFLVELGPTLTAAEADIHAKAVVTIAGELD